MRRSLFAALAFALLAPLACSTDHSLRPSLHPSNSGSGTIAADATSQIFITEIMADPSKVADASGEWFELFNAGTASVDLNGWKITSGPTGSEQHTIATSLVIAAGGYVVIGNNTDQATNGGVPENYSYGTAIALNNSNTDWLTIKTPDGTLIDSVAYAVRTNGTPGAYSPPTGASKAVVDLSVDHTIIAGNANWKTSTETYGLGDKGTPGTGPYTTVQPAGPVVTVTVTPNPTTVTLGGTKQLGATGTDANGRTSTTTFTWKSADPTIVTVDAAGVVTGVKQGTVTITATSANDVAGTATVTVVPPGAVGSVTIAINDPAQVPVGFTKPAFPTVRDADGVILSPPPTLTWASSNPSVATVDSLGYITGVSPGKVVISATAPNGISGTASFTVEPGAAPTPAVYRNNLEFGTPTKGNTNDEILLVKPQYVVSYNKYRGEPNWVAWDLNATQFGSAPRCDCFSADPQLPADVYHVVDYDYRNSGYDRGHMAQSESRTTTDQENASTFLMTNILPQAAENNQGPWSAFENYLNDLVRTQNKEVYVIAGGIWSQNPGTLKNEGRVQIPDYTFKIAVIVPAGTGLANVQSANDLQVIAVKMPNLITAGGPASAVGIRNLPWQNFQTTVDAIEAATGYDYLDKLTDTIEAIVESGDRAPVANAGGPYTAGAGSVITFDGSKSSDPDGDALRFWWHFGDGTIAQGQSVTHTYFHPGSYTVTLVVVDPLGASSTITTTVTVSSISASVSQSP